MMQGSFLLKYRLKAFANGFKGLGFKKAMRPISILTLGTLFVIGDYWFFHRVIVYLDGLPSRVGDELIVQLINLVFITLFMMVLFSCLIVSLSVYYLSRDLELLHSLPGRYFSDNGFNEALPHPQNASDNDFYGVIFSGGSGGVFAVFVTG